MQHPLRPSIKWIAIAFGLLTVSTFGCIFSIFPTMQQPTFVTQAWQDPGLICGTWWLWYEIDDPERNIQELIRQGIEASDLAMEMTSAYADGTRFEMCGGDEPLSSASLHLTLAVPDDVLNDTVLLGDYIIEIVAILQNNTQISLPNGRIGVLDIQFTSADAEINRRWQFQYVQLLDAIEAGLQGDDIWLIGQ